MPPTVDMCFNGGPQAAVYGSGEEGVGNPAAEQVKAAPGTAMLVRIHKYAPGWK